MAVAVEAVAAAVGILLRNTTKFVSMGTRRSSKRSRFEKWQMSRLDGAQGYLDIAWAWTSTGNIVTAIACSGSVLTDTSAISCGTFCRRRLRDTALGSLWT